MKRILTLTLLIAVSFLSMLPGGVLAQDETEITGHWEARIDVEGATIPVSLTVGRNEDGELAAELSQSGNPDAAMPVEITVDGSTVTLESDELRLFFEGDVSVSGSRIKGLWNQSGKSFRVTFKKERERSREKEAEDVPAVVDTTAANEYLGHWVGDLKIESVELTIVLNLTDTGEVLPVVTLDSPDQGASGIEAEIAYLTGDSIVIAVPSLNARFMGRPGEGYSRLEGEFMQSGMILPLVLDHQDTPYAMRRPQEPTEPLPYRTEEVSFENEDAGVTLAGTLTLPEGEGLHPAVVLVSGSGPQDRNEMVFGHKPFLVIADYLTREGIAVLRYDDRGFGESTGDFAAATTEDFTGDALAAVDYLRRRGDINPSAIGMLGHSEGGLIAPRAAVESGDLAFIVLLAAPAQPGDDIIRSQTELIAVSEGVEDSLIDFNRDLLDRWFETIRAHDDLDTVKQKLSEIADSVMEELSESEREALGLTRQELTAQVQQSASPWFKYFIEYDPYPTLQKVEAPVLALFGENDLQVSADENARLMREALESGKTQDFEVHIFDNLNHLFQTAETGSPNEYAEIEETISPEVLEKIAYWIVKHTPNHDE